MVVKAIPYTEDGQIYGCKTSVTKLHECTPIRKNIYGCETSILNNE